MNSLILAKVIFRKTKLFFKENWQERQYIFETFCDISFTFFSKKSNFSGEIDIISSTNSLSISKKHLIYSKINSFIKRLF